MVFRRVHATITRFANRKIIIFYNAHVARSWEVKSKAEGGGNQKRLKFINPSGRNKALYGTLSSFCFQSSSFNYSSSSLFFSRLDLGRFTFPGLGKLGQKLELQDIFRERGKGERGKRVKMIRISRIRINDCLSVRILVSVC